MSTLGFKLRPVDEVLGEIRAAWNTGYREVHFRDQTFGANKNRSLELCAALHQEFPKLTWSCFSRVDVLDEQRIKAFVEAGCHTVIVGIEFDDDAMQKTLGKNIAKTQMFEAVRACRAHGLRIAGTFILGLPDQDEAAILRTGKLARDLNLDFASFNLATPRLGTTWRKELLEQGGIDKERWGMDTVGGTTAWDKAKLSPQALNRLRSKVERDFYLRPGYLLRKLAALRSTAEALTYLRNGLSILFGKH